MTEWDSQQNMLNQEWSKPRCHPQELEAMFHQNSWLCFQEWLEEHKDRLCKTWESLDTVRDPLESPRLQGEIRLINMILSSNFQVFLKRWNIEKEKSDKEVR